MQTQVKHPKEQSILKVGNDEDVPFSSKSSNIHLPLLKMVRDFEPPMIAPFNSMHMVNIPTHQTLYMIIPGFLSGGGQCE